MRSKQRIRKADARADGNMNVDPAAKANGDTKVNSDAHGAAAADGAGSAHVNSYFGTDGIRGVANSYPMTPEIALQLGKAVARHFRDGRHPQVVVGKDTRLSGYLFENAITAGLLSAGATVFLVGPLPTPAVAHITRSFAADAGIMITASHNPSDHNGIKLFDRNGRKLPDRAEAAIERMMAASLEKRGAESSPEPIGKARRIEDARGRYIEFVKGTVKNRSLAGLKIVLDCANGAAYSIAPVIFEELGAEVITLNDQPDGLNINAGCGALHPEVIAEAVRREQADVGIALDGDADRVIMVDERGENVDGDHLLAILALDAKREGTLRGSTVVGTDYTNKGFDEAMAEAGITVLRVANGDRYVLEALDAEGLNLGGEQSGHLILLDYATTGDGTLAALQVLAIMRKEGKRLSQLAAAMRSWPQRTESIAVSRKRPIAELPKVVAAIASAERTLGADGRLLVRYSGTEAKARVMVEAKRADRIDAIIAAIVAAFREEGL